MSKIKQIAIDDKEEFTEWYNSKIKPMIDDPDKMHQFITEVMGNVVLWRERYVRERKIFFVLVGLNVLYLILI